MCTGGVHSILLLPLVARDNRCMYMAHVCFYVCCNHCVGVCGKVCCVAGIVKDSVFSLGVVKYVVRLCRGCDGNCVFCLKCEAWSCMCSCMLYVCVLCASYGSPQCCVLHDLQFVYVGRG